MVTNNNYVTACVAKINRHVANNYYYYAKKTQI